MVHHLETTGVPRRRILLMGRSLGASVGLLALVELEREGRGPLAGIIWEARSASSRDFAERLVRDRRTAGGMCSRPPSAPRRPSQRDAWADTRPRTRTFCAARKG